MISILKASKFVMIIALLISIAAVMASDNELEPGEEADQRVQRAINAAPQVLAKEDNLKWPMFTAGLCSVGFGILNSRLFQGLYLASILDADPFAVDMVSAFVSYASPVKELMNVGFITGGVTLLYRSVAGIYPWNNS